MEFNCPKIYNSDLLADVYITSVPMNTNICVLVGKHPLAHPIIWLTNHTLCYKSIIANWNTI